MEMAVHSSLPTKLLLIILLLINSFRHGFSNVKFAPGTAYRYQYMYVGRTEMGVDTGAFSITAEFSIIGLSFPSMQDHTQDCRLVVLHYDVVINNNGVEYVPEWVSRLNFSRWMAFSISHHGEIQNVYYPKTESSEVIAMKKMLLGTLSSKLIISVTNLANKQRWAYEVNETTHEGKQSSVYHAEPIEDGIIFTKTRKSRLTENSEELILKTVQFSTVYGIPNKLHLKEHFISQNQVTKWFQSQSMRERDESVEDSDATMDFSQMKGSGEANIELLSLEFKNEYMNTKLPQNLITDSIIVGEAANQLLTVASTDEDDPDQNAFECKRVRTGLEDIETNNVEGFEYQLHVPSTAVHLVVCFGGSKLGLCLGLIVKNNLDIKLGPRDGEVNVDILDSAFATFHLVPLFGIKIEIDIFRSELRFKKQMTLNDFNKFLKKYGVRIELGDLYDMVKPAADIIRTSMNQFKDTSLMGYTPGEILEDLTIYAEKLHLKGSNLLTRGERFVKDKYKDLPQIVDYLEKPVEKTMSLFKKVTSGIYKTFYNAM